MLEQENNFFKAHEQEFLQKYQNRYIVVHGSAVVGDFDAELDAYAYGSKNFAPGSFLIKHCVPTAPQNFFSRVKFG